MKCYRWILSFLIAGLILVPTPLDALKKKTKFTKLQLTEPVADSPPRSRSGSPVNGASSASESPPSNLHPPSPGSSGSTGATLVAPKESFPQLPGSSRRDKSPERRKHDDFPALDGNRLKNVDHHARTPPPVQRKASLPPQIESILSKNPFARLPGAHKSSKPVKQTEEFPPLSSSSDRLNANRNSALPGRSHHAGASDEQPLKSPEAHRKFSLQEFPALPGSSHAKSPSIRPSLESLATSQSKLSLDQFPALPSSSKHHGIRKNSQAGLNPSANPEQKISLDEFPALGPSKGRLESSNLRLQNTQSSGNLQTFFREGSIDSTKSLRLPNQFNSPLNSPFFRNKDFFGSSSSISTSSSGFGMHPSFSSGSLSSSSSGRYSPAVGRTRKLSDIAQVSQTSVAVSDQTCKDDTSPAEQCFNYFTFSLFWPPALGYEYKSKNKPINDNVNSLKWSIHALWPSSYSGNVPENCKKRTSVSFSQHRFDREKGLRDDLENKWMNICPYKLHGSSVVSFWDREFSKHGACVSRSLMIASDVGYFKMANNLFDDVGIARVLLNIGFEVGTKMNYGDLVEKVNEKLGKRTRVEFVTDKKTKELYLKEIRVCYDLNFHRINCPGTTLLSTDLAAKEIVYLDHVPSIE